LGIARMHQDASMSRPKFLPYNSTLALIGTIVVASLLPCRGAALEAVDHLTNVAIALLFFLRGAKLSRQAVIAGASHWRLHALVLLTTFLLCPLFGLALKPHLSPLVTPTLYAGILFLCTLPSTVQSSIAFTTIAKGNVPAAGLQRFGLEHHRHLCHAASGELRALDPCRIGFSLAHRR
jgi:solute carrier family 10 (sodium/bile acid cotransporter), member 7